MTPSSAGGLFLDGHDAWLGMGAILPDYRRRGGQRALMTQRIRDAIAAGATRIFSETGEPQEQGTNPSAQQHGTVRLREAGDAHVVRRSAFHDWHVLNRRDDDGRCCSFDHDCTMLAGVVENVREPRLDRSAAATRLLDARRLRAEPRGLLGPLQGIVGFCQILTCGLQPAHASAQPASPRCHSRPSTSRSASVRPPLPEAATARA